MLAGNFKRTQRGTKILWGRGTKCFTTLGGTNSKTARYLLSYFFRLNTLKGNRKNYLCGSFKSGIVKKVKKIV